MIVRVYCVWLVLFCGVAVAAVPPAITGATPNPIDAGGPYFLMTVTGSGFVPGSTVKWRSVPTNTDYVSPTELKVAITFELRAFAGQYNLTVLNPDGTVSNPYSVLIKPVIATVTPGAVLVGSAATPITVTGIGFNERDDVLVLTISSQRITLPTTWINQANLTAVVPATAFSSPAAATIEVFDRLTGLASALLPFSIIGQPLISAVSPNPIDAGGPGFLLTVMGSGFTPASVVSLAAVPLDTTFVSPSQLRAAITPEHRALSGTYSVTVTAPGGIGSAPSAFRISPVLASLSPASALVGSSPISITAAGIGFTPQSVIAFTFAGLTSRLTTTYVNSSTLTTVIPSSSLSIPGAAAIHVLNSAGQDVSAVMPFTIRSAAAILSASPNIMDAAGPGLLIAVTGAGFVPASVLKWAGTPLGTTFASATQLSATITPALRAFAGTFLLTVTDPAGGTSAGYPVTISPVLFSLSPASAAALGPAIAITAAGAGFTPNSVLRFNTFGLVTAYVNSTTLTAVVPAEALSAAGAASVQVLDFTGPGRSLPQSFSISGTAPIISGVSPAVVPVGTAFTLTVSGSGFFAGSTVLWNGAALITTFAGPAQLSAAVPAELVGSTGTAAVTVSNPGGVVSNGAGVSDRRCDGDHAHQPRPLIPHGWFPSLHVGRQRQRIPAGLNRPVERVAAHHHLCERHSGHSVRAFRHVGGDPHGGYYRLETRGQCLEQPEFHHRAAAARDLNVDAFHSAGGQPRALDRHHRNQLRAGLRSAVERHAAGHQVPGCDRIDRHRTGESAGKRGPGYHLDSQPQRNGFSSRRIHSFRFRARGNRP